MTLNIPPYDPSKVSTTYGNLQLLFSNVHNGDIYDFSKTPPFLICSSGPPLKRVKHKSNIPETIERMIPSFDGTLIRIYYFDDTWYFSSRKHIKAENGTWPCKKNVKTFKQIFEEFCKFENFDIYLNRSKSYTFLLLSKSIQNVLPNLKNELFLISVFDRDSKIICANPLPIDRPSWASQIINSSICGQYSNTIDNIQLEIVRPQRGFLYYTTEGNIFQIDYNYFQKWESVIQNKPWQVVFYEMLKLQVTKKQMSVSLNEFCTFYKDNGIYDFQKQLILLYKIADVICFWDVVTSDELRKNYLLNSIFLTICAKNKSELIPTHSFCVRQIAFMKYLFLDELFSKQNMDELFIVLDNIKKLKIEGSNGEWETIN